ncbi:hypothetical protein ACFPFX_02115 [Streptomyces mauvecolor]|uniref:Uncharacterized protein n=1 Tax=Streptomyces mauvecolor TaxID=58345 RepID=A0ABV9UHZ3_9ACTN
MPRSALVCVSAPGVVDGEAGGVGGTGVGDGEAGGVGGAGRLGDGEGREGPPCGGLAGPGPPPGFGTPGEGVAAAPGAPADPDDDPLGLGAPEGPPGAFGSCLPVRPLAAPCPPLPSSVPAASPCRPADADGLGPPWLSLTLMQPADAVSTRTVTASSARRTGVVNWRTGAPPEHGAMGT